MRNVERINIVEVGPRDGLQNESVMVPTDAKLAFIGHLVGAGLRQIEVTSFVRPQAVPQLADAEEIVRRLPPAAAAVIYSALVPNERGLERALACGIRRIAVFTAASETFAQQNINMSVARSLNVFAAVIAAARGRGLSVRGYVSTCFVCPYEGEVAKERVRDVTERLLALGVDQVAISDTIGAAAPRDIDRTVGYVLQTVPREKLALHLHDTYGTALANVHAGLQLGITTFDAAAGGLGGCPYAPGASGNLATEDLVYLLERMGLDTGVDLERVAEASSALAALLGREPPSKQWKRLHAAGQRRRLSPPSTGGSEVVP